MISNSILSLLWSIISPVLIKIPNISIDVNAIESSSFYDYIRAGLYFFPLSALLPLFALIFGIWLLRVIIAFFKTLWGVLPFI